MYVIYCEFLLIIVFGNLFIGDFLILDDVEEYLRIEIKFMEILLGDFGWNGILNEGFVICSVVKVFIVNKLVN